MQLNHTHDATTKSWLESANAIGCDFPVQNLPFSVFRRASSNGARGSAPARLSHTSFKHQYWSIAQHRFW